jgi:GT2 family glycosyltransferase
VLSASVIVPTYNRPAALARTLEALRGMDFPADRLELVVVDSGPVDRGADAVARSHHARYERCPDRGVSAARNHGAGVASGELLMFVDDDIVVGESNLRQHEAIHARNDRCLVSGHWEFDPELRLRLEASPLGRFRLAYEDEYNKPHGVEGAAVSGQVHPQSLAAANLSIRAEIFHSLGGFDGRFPVGAEDQDLAWRAARAGCVLVYDFDIRVIHNDQHSDLVSLCMRQERGAIGTVYFARKNPDAPAPAMLAMNGPVRRDDQPRTVARKLSRAALSRRVPLAVAHRTIRLVERLRPNGGWPLEYMYRAVGGLHVFRGVRRGLRLTSDTEWASAHEAS